MLIDRDRLTKPMLYLSTQIEQTKQEYSARLQAARTHGQQTEWIRYFLQAVTACARDAVRRADTVLQLRDRLRAKPQLQRKFRALRLIDDLFVNPYVTVSGVAKQLDVGKPAATASIKLLESLGILREHTGKQYGRVWKAEPILHAINADLSESAANQDPLPGE